MSKIPQWVDNPDFDKIGTVRYLVAVDRAGQSTRWQLRERPARTNRSAEPRLFGWCGETDNRSVYAHGCVVVVGTNQARDRARIKSLDGEELRAFLEGDGYPELEP
jgi:hypothetical protein